MQEVEGLFRQAFQEVLRQTSFQLLLPAPSPQELWDLLTTVPLSAYQDARQRLDVAEERQRWFYRLRRRPLKTATSVVDEYLTLRLLVRQFPPQDPKTGSFSQSGAATKRATKYGMSFPVARKTLENQKMRSRSAFPTRPW